MNRPLIGLNTDAREEENGLTYFLRARYVHAVQEAGGRPVLLPPLEGEEASASLKGLNGLVLTGGDDLSPALYGGGSRHPEERPRHPLREAFDMALVKEAVRIGLPVLAICLGHQELCVAFGGGLHPYLPDAVPSVLQHRIGETMEANHPLQVEPGTLLARLLGAHPRVNSGHRQAVSRPGRGLKVAARTADGVIEAVEGTGPSFLIGVPWHPELMGNARTQVRLFEGLIAHAARFPLPRD